MSYPHILTEDETLQEALKGRSLARYGDGELRLARGGTSASQKADKNLARELRIILEQKTSVLACTPHTRGPRASSWQKYMEKKFLVLFKQDYYGSAFITRPDNAPWIDTPEFWVKMRSLWAGKDVTLVAGSERSLTPERMADAKSVRLVKGRYRDSYEIIGQLVEEVGKPSGPVILCLGATATVMAYRLANRGVWALDLGHCGMFLRRRGYFDA